MDGSQHRCQASPVTIALAYLGLASPCLDITRQDYSRPRRLVDNFLFLGNDPFDSKFERSIAILVSPSFPNIINYVNLHKYDTQTPRSVKQK